jgi:Zn2+/Cd2+-exporting ATPase
LLPTTLAAIAIKQLPEAVGMMLFFKVGELFQELAVSRSRLAGFSLGLAVMYGTALFVSA